MMRLIAHGSAEEAEDRAETLASATYLQVRRDIVQAIYRPGQKLLLRDLCARYGVGLAPVREALNRLTSDDLVVQTDQRGFRVAPVSLAHLDDLTETRCLLEATCLRDSVQGEDAAWRKALQAAFQRLAPLDAPDASPDAAARRAWERAHRGFHAALIGGGRSPILRRLCAQLGVLAERYGHLAGLRGPGRLEEHRAVLEAALAGQADRAAQLLETHYRATTEAIRESLMRRPG